MKSEAQLCLQCGAMDWSLISSDYVQSFRVRRDGRIAFKETFEKIEYVCNKCGSTSALLGVKASPSTYRKLASLTPMQRILKALEYIVEGTLRVTDSDMGPDEVLDCIEGFRQRWLMKHERSAEELEDFVSKAKGIVGRWKLLEEP